MKCIDEFIVLTLSESNFIQKLGIKFILTEIYKHDYWIIFAIAVIQVPYWILINFLTQFQYNNKNFRFFLFFPGMF